jgi:hypothetical protein
MKSRIAAGLLLWVMVVALILIDLATRLGRTVALATRPLGRRGLEREEHFSRSDGRDPRIEAPAHKSDHR